MRLGERIRSVREGRGLTQLRLAQLAGVVRATIESMETDPGYSPRVETLGRIAGALGVRMVDLLDAGADAENGGLISEIAATAKALPQEHQVMARDLLRAMLFSGAMNQEQVEGRQPAYA